MLDTLELMAQRADELEQTYDNNVMVPGLPMPGAVSFESEVGLPVPRSGGNKGVPVSGQLIQADGPVHPIVSQAQGTVSPGNEMTLAELDQVYDQATEEVLDALFLLDEDLNSGLDILTNSITTYNGKSMRLQIQQRDILKDMGKIFRDWWEVTERDRNKPETLKLNNDSIGNGSDVQTGQSQQSGDAGGGGFGLDDLMDFGGGDDKDRNTKDDKRNDKNKNRGGKRGFFNKIKGWGGAAFDKGAKFMGGKWGKVAALAGTGALAYTVLSDDRDDGAVMTPEQIAKRQAEARTGTLMDPETGHQITWDEYDARYGQQKTSEFSPSMATANASTNAVIEPGQASIPASISEVSNAENDPILSNTQMVGAAGLTVLGGMTVANNMQNREPAMPQFDPMDAVDRPKSNKLPSPEGAKPKPKVGTISKLAKGAKGLKGVPIVAPALAGLEAYSILNDETMDQKTKTVELSGVAGGLAGGAIGAKAGAAGGAALGTMIFPGVGTVIGGALGGLAGGIGGYFLGESGAESLSTGIYDTVSSVGDFFGFGGDPDEENVQTAAALTAQNPLPAGEEPIVVPPTDKAASITEVAASVAGVPKINATTNPVEAVSQLNAKQANVASAVGGVDSKKKAKVKEEESSIMGSIFNAAAMAIPGVGFTKAMYENTSLSDISNFFSGDDVTSQQTTSQTTNKGDVSTSNITDQSFFAEMAEKMKVVTKMVPVLGPATSLLSMMTSPAVSSMSESVTNFQGDESETQVVSSKVTNQAPAAVTNQATSEIVQVQPSTENADRSNFTTIREVAAPAAEKADKQPIIVQAPPAKKEPKPRTRVIKQVVQPRPTIDDTPTMIGNGGLGLLGNSIV